ncbi:uncharacterized protein L203_106338 [Cryptococcus depauperatus CBS 7841]|uniref:Thiamine-binding protein domain-containing protein n=1 Tax=Cryptococcus depauperatus CBS 7841 TaxID=1295531 RepID=A0AAJ8JZ48_9TREE
MTNPLYAVADFCLIPMGLPTSSVGPEIAEVQRVLEKTAVEGPWDEVVKVIGDCHKAVHAMGTPRIATDIRIGTRTDKKISSGGNDGKVKRVEEILAKKSKA